MTRRETCDVDGMVLACPECDRAGGIYYRTVPEIVEREGRLRCNLCDHRFDDEEGVIRPPKQPTPPADGRSGLSDAGKAALETDVDDVDLLGGEV